LLAVAIPTKLSNKFRKIMAKGVEYKIYLIPPYRSPLLSKERGWG
jgi:hypothetical protein